MVEEIKAIPKWSDPQGRHQVPIEERESVPASEVRRWAHAHGIEVGRRGHLSADLIRQFNEANRTVKFVDRNPNPKHEV